MEPLLHVRPTTAQAVRWAVVTGASSGIGKAIAEELSKAGYGAILIAREQRLLELIAHRLQAQTPSVPLAIDLSKSQGLTEAGEEISRLCGSVDVLVNCAGFGIYKPLLEHTHEDFDRLMAVNFDSARRLTQHFLPGMLRRGRGHIFHICSMTGRVGGWGLTGYSASKSAMKGFANALAIELVGTGVRSTLVYPGIIRTPYFAHPTMGRLWEKVGHRAITPDKVARAVVRSIGRDRAALYVPRINRVIDVIEAVSPGLAARIVRAGSMPKQAQKGARHL